MTLPRAMPDTTVSQATRQRALLVLGMHRSGTSALTRMLSLLGCALPRTLMPAHESNAAGHWESAAIADLNDQILAAAGSTWDDWLPVNPDFTTSSEGQRWLDAATTCLNEEFGDQPLFVLKDPRICRLVPFWREVLHRQSIEPLAVLPLRNPYEVAKSLAARNGINEEEGLLLWLRHALDAEATTRDIRRAFVTYDQVLEDWSAQVDRIAETLGLTWPRLSGLTSVEIESFLAPSLHHHHSTLQDSARLKTTAPWVAQAYAILLNWAVNGEREEDWSSLDRLRASFDDAGLVLLRPFLAARKSASDLQTTVEDRDFVKAENTALAKRNEELIGERSQLAQEHERLANDLTNTNSLRERLQQTLDEVIAERDSLAKDREDIFVQNDKFVKLADTLTAEKTDLIAQLDSAADRQSQNEQYMREISTERDALQATCESLTLQLRAEQQIAGRHWADARRLEDERETYVAMIKKLEEDLKREQLIAAQNWEERCRFLSETNFLQQTLNRVENERGELRDRLAIEQIEHRHALDLAESHLRQRDEHIAQAEALLIAANQKHTAELSDASTQVAALNDALNALQESAKFQAADMACISSQLDVRQAELDAMRTAFGTLQEEASAETHRQQVAITQERWRRDEIDRQRQVAVNELDSVRSRLAELEARPDLSSDLATAIAERDNERIRFAQQLASRAEKMEILNQDLTSAREKSEALSAELTHVNEAWQAKLAHSNQALHAQTAQRDNMLNAHERARHISSALLHTPWWWGIVSPRTRTSWLEKRLSRRGLFDAQAYRERYPDVAQSGMPAVQHFLLHGLAEGREG